jgi:hypothetical protein
MVFGRSGIKDLGARAVALLLIADKGSHHHIKPKLYQWTLMDLGVSVTVRYFSTWV